MGKDDILESEAYKRYIQRQNKDNKDKEDKDNK
jgi:hypothetical protein